jgi:S-DNA-T family DNA segregation ATPase FtsK/SpoIIIE
MSLDQHPELPADWDPSKVIPGELVVPDDLSDELDDDDIPPGIVVPYEPRLPVLRQAGSAAMVVASVTGRAIGLTARGTGTGLRWFGVGARAVGYLGWRYIRTHDYQEAVGGISSGTDFRRNKEERRARWKLLGWTAGITAGLNLAGWWALVKYASLTAADSWWMTPATTALAAATAVTWYGRYRLSRPGIAPEQIIADMDDPESDEPFPLSYCQSADRVEECVSRALAYEGIGTRAIRVIGHREWGWEVDVVLKGSTPGRVNAVADQLDSHFNIKKGGTLIDPDPQQSAHLVLRLVTSNPFENMPRPAVHAPNSLDISDPHNFGRCMDGSPLDLVLEGLRILAIGVSGAAKTTGVLRDLAEVITACHNAIAIEMDPIKDGLREFEGAMAVPPIRGNKACEQWLANLVKMASGRNAVRNRRGMGDTWDASRDHPAIFVFVDEFIFLSQKAKGSFIELLRIGKQSGIYPIAAGQDATSDSMGDAIADTFTLSIMLAARHADIPLVLGSGAINDGYRPDRLVPAQNKQHKNDAGQSYIKGPGLDRPLLYGWNEHSNEAIKQAVVDRKAAGRPWFDRDTLAAAGLLHLAGGAAAPRVSGDRKIAQDAAFVMTNQGVDRMRTETLTKALGDAFPDAYEDLTAAELRALLKDVGAGPPMQLGPCEGEQNPRGFTIDALTAL